MLYELALTAVLVAGGYWGWYFVRHKQTQLYGVLQIAAAALSGIGLLGRKLDESAYGIAGAVGVGAGVCLLLIAPFVRGAARRFASSERFGAAKILYDIAEVLAPGSGVGLEKDVLGAMREIRDGNIGRAVESMTAAKHGATPEGRLAIDERIAMLYLQTSRWEEAIAFAEEHLLDAPGGEAGPGPIALRRALGIAPAVWVELLGAYGYQGKLDQAARMLARLEDVCAGRPDATMWLHRGRLLFLAHAGRTTAVETLVEPRRSRHMTAAARSYWRAVAYERRGERATAEAAYTKARSRSRGRPRELIDQALERLSTAAPAELGPVATEVVARVEAEPPPAVVQPLRPRGPVATYILVASVLAAAVATSVAYGSWYDTGVLVREGALLRTLVDAGQWWRVVTCMFLHVGVVHLAANVVSLWFLGRLCEELFGSWRTVAIYAIAGLGGAVASLLSPTAHLSAGASGAIFGVVGAIFVELTWHRKLHRLAWTRGVWGAVLVVVVAQLGTDFMSAINDQWAHAGGLVTGALVGALMSPNARWQRWALQLSRGVAAVFAAATITSFVFAAQTSLAEDMALAPALGEQLLDFEPDRIPATGNIDAYITGTPARAHEKGYENVVAAKDTVIPMPAGYTSNEYVGTLPNALGGQSMSRIVVALCPGRVITLYIPETVAHAAPEYFTHLILSL